MEILQRIILTAKFEDATPPEGDIIHMWYDGLNKVIMYVTFDRHENPRFIISLSNLLRNDSRSVLDVNMEQHNYSPILV